MPVSEGGRWGKSRVIIHLDMDAFFAAVEQTIHPALRGKPVIVGGKPDSRGVVSTCSYEARNYGVHSAMPMKEAYRLCPEGIYIDTSGDKYSYISYEVVNILKKYSDAVEPVSIDESFVDITKVHDRYGGPREIALAIKRDIKENFNLTASIGIAPNRFVAKMASSFNKPDGLVVIYPSEVKQFLWVQPIEHLWGVGPKSAAVLKKFGIVTIGDLAKESEAKLKKMFGIMGPALVKMANGEGCDEVSLSHLESFTKSMGHEHTFAMDTNDPRVVLGFLLYQSDKVSRRLRVFGYVGRTITLKVRRSDFTRLTRANSLTVYVDSEQEIYKTARKLLLDNRFLDRPIRLIGVGVSNLKKKTEERNDDLFVDYDFLKKSRRVNQVIDKLRDQHGEESIFYAGTKVF